MIIFGADISSSVHIDNKQRHTLILGKGPMQGLVDTTLTAEVRYAINFTHLRKRFTLCLHDNGSNSFLFINNTKIYQFKAKDSEIKYCTLCLGISSKDFITINMKKIRLRGSIKFFSVDFNSVDTNDILDICKYFMKET